MVYIEYGAPQAHGGSGIGNFEPVIPLLFVPGWCNLFLATFLVLFHALHLRYPGALKMAILLHPVQAILMVIDHFT